MVNVIKIVLLFTIAFVLTYMFVVSSADSFESVRTSLVECTSHKDPNDIRYFKFYCPSEYYQSA